MSYLGQHPDPRGESPTADHLLCGGLTQNVLRRGPIYTLVESDLWSYVVILVPIGQGSTFLYS